MHSILYENAFFLSYKIKFNDILEKKYLFFELLQSFSNDYAKFLYFLLIKPTCVTFVFAFYSRRVFKEHKKNLKIKN